METLNKETQKAVEDEIKNLEQTMGASEGETSENKAGGVFEGDASNEYKLSLIDLFERAFPDGLKTAAAYPKKALFNVASMGLSENDKKKIEYLSNTSDPIIAIKVAILKSLLKDYGQIKVDSRVAYLAVEAADDVPMILQVLEHKKNLKIIDDHVEQQND